MKNMKSNIMLTLINVFLPIFMYMMLGPAEVYSANTLDFDFLLFHFEIAFICAGVIVWLICSAIIVLLPEKVNRLVNCFIFYFSIMSYIQNMFLNVKIAESDGTNVDWSSMKMIIAINTIVWIVFFIFIFYFVFIKNHTKLALYVTIFILAIQLVAFVSIIITNIIEKPELAHHQLTSDNQFCVAPNKNIIVLIIDATGNQTYDEICAKDTSISKCLSDFTYYNNYDSVYKPTFPSIIYSLTRYEADVSKKRIEWSKDAWNSEKSKEFFKQLHDNEFVCNLYTKSQSYTLGDIEAAVDKIDNLSQADITIKKNLLYPMMLKYSIYRYCPYILKPRFEVIPSHFETVTGFSIKDDISEMSFDMLEKLNDNGLTINNKYNNALIIQHMNGLHNISEKDIKDGATDHEKLQSAMLVVSKYFDELKRLGLYDSSTIIVCSDHGSHTNELDNQAVFFIKDAYEHHDNIVINTAPVSNSEFQSTILYCAGIDNTHFDKTIYDWSENAERERTTYIIDGGIMGYTYVGNRYELINTELDGYDVKYYSEEW